MTPTEKVKWMRENGIVRAKWDGENLVECELSAQLPPTEPTAPLTEEQIADIKKREAEAEEALTFGAA